MLTEVHLFCFWETNFSSPEFGHAALHICSLVCTFPNASHNFYQHSFGTW